MNLYNIYDVNIIRVVKRVFIILKPNAVGLIVGRLQSVTVYVTLGGIRLKKATKDVPGELKHFAAQNQVWNF